MVAHIRNWPSKVIYGLTNERTVRRWRIELSRKRSQIALVGELMRVMNVKKHQLIILITASSIIAVLDSVGLGLLLPLAQGLAASDFTGVELPAILAQSMAWLLARLHIANNLAGMFFALASMILGVNLLAIALGFLYNYYGQYLQGKYQWHLHTFIYGRYFTFGKLFFDKNSQGSIKTVLHYTARIVELVRIAQNNLTNFTKLLAYLVVMAWLSREMMVFTILIFPVLYWASRRIMKKVGRLWQRAKDITLDLGRESFNMISSLPLVWSYSREGEAKEKYAHMNEELRRVQLKAQALGYFTVLVPQIMTLMILFLAIGWVSLIIQRGQTIDLMRVVIFLYVASRTVPLLKVFNTIWVVLAEITPPIVEVMRLFRDKEKYIVAEGARKFTGLRTQLEFRNLTFFYGHGEPILHNVSFTVPKGSVTALVGPSGSGKSTIINLLMRFYECPRGAILLDGVDIRDFTFASLRRHMAVVDQEPILLHDTLRHNLLYGNEHVSEARLRHVMERIHLQELVERLPRGLETITGDRGVQLSGGEKQRVAICRALLKGAEIILLDEATSALDSTTEQAVQEEFREAVLGKTALVIAHRLSTVRAVDSIVYLDHGRVTEQGGLDDLLRQKGAFARQWRAQAMGEGARP